MYSKHHGSIRPPLKHLTVHMQLRTFWGSSYDTFCQHIVVYTEHTWRLDVEYLECILIKNITGRKTKSHYFKGLTVFFIQTQHNQNECMSKCKHNRMSISKEHFNVLCLLVVTFLPRVIWADRYHAHICPCASLTGCWTSYLAR